MRKRRSKKPGKGKVRNATPTEIDGIKFKSKLEAYTYKKLKENNIKADYEKVTFTILEGFVYDGRKVRDMTYTPDFTNLEEGFIIEDKGYANESFPLRWKVFQYFLYMNKLDYKLYKPRTTAEVDAMVEDILSRRNEKRN